MMDPRQAFTDSARLMDLGARIMRERPVEHRSNVIRFPVERLGQHRR